MRLQQRIQRSKEMAKNWHKMYELGMRYDYMLSFQHLELLELKSSGISCALRSSCGLTWILFFCLVQQYYNITIFQWTQQDSHAFLNLSAGVMESNIVFMNELYEIACKYVWNIAARIG